MLELLLIERQAEGYKIKDVTGEDTMMGSLLGWNFDTELQGGYAYFWSSGIVSYQLINYVTGDDILEDTAGEMDDEGIDELIKIFRASL